jgi:hypothetical protein
MVKLVQNTTINIILSSEQEDKINKIYQIKQTYS